MKNKSYFLTSSFLSSSALALILGLSPLVAHSTAFTVNGLLTGDTRPGNPDNLFVNVTITGDTDSNQAFWIVDINSPAHPNIKLDEFYFSLTGNATDYLFYDFDPTGWAVNSPASTQGL